MTDSQNHRPHDEAWSTFWKSNRGSGRTGGCLPSGWQGIDAAQRSAWHAFASRINKNARVLDVATGDGRVMGWLLAIRPDLDLTGVDRAPVLPDPPKGTKVEAGVAMERLPFADGYFAAAVSQFGFEYGDTALAAAELARVTADDAVIGLMTHRIDGPILEHNLRRREQIAWAIEDQDLIETAKRSLALRASGMMTTSPKVQNAPAEGARLFGQSSAAWEIAEAVRRTMIAGASRTEKHVAQTLDMIGDQARNELGRIASLEAACGTTADRATLMTAFDSAGLRQVSEDSVMESSTKRPFADSRILRKA